MERTSRRFAESGGVQLRRGVNHWSGPSFDAGDEELAIQLADHVHTPDLATRRVMVNGAFLLTGMLSLGVTSITRLTPESAGLILVISHAADILAVVWLCWLAISIGIGVIGRRPNLSPVPKACAALVLGLTVVSTVVLGVGLLGALRPVAWGILPIGALVAFVFKWPAAAAVLLVDAAHDSSPKGAGSVLAVGAIGLMTVVLVLFALQPVQDFDSLMYHLLLPSAWLDAGHLYLPDDSFHVAFIGSIQMLNMPMELFDVRAGPALLQVVPVVALAFLSGNFAARYGGSSAGPLGICLITGSSALLIMAYVPRIDGWLVLAVALTHFLLLGIVGESDPGARSLLLVIGGLSGAAFAIKYQAIPFVAAAMVFSVGYALLRKDRRFLGALPVSAALGLVVAAPWLVKNILLVGSPLYPLFAEHLTWGWLDSLVPGYEVGDRFRPLAQARAPFSLGAWIMNPDSLFMQQDGHFGGLHPIMVFAPLGLAARSRWLAALALAMSLGGVAITIAISPETNLRYLSPAFAGLALSSAIGLTWLVERIDIARRRTYLLVIASIMVLPSLVWSGTRLLDGALPFAIGVESEATWATRPSNVELAELRSLDSWLADIGARHTLLLWENQVAGFDSDVIQDVRQTNWPHLWTALDGQCPSDEVFSHVVVNPGFRTFLIGRGMDPVANHLPEFASFAERCLIYVGTRAGYELYEVGGAEDK